MASVSQPDTPEIPDADEAVVSGEAPPSERVPLDRARIIDAAVLFVEEQGLRELTMRRLGGVLGVEAMSLYRYVSGRDDLLDGIVETLMAGMYDDPDVLKHPRDGWQDFLQRMAHGIRRIAIGHPQAFPLVASRPTEAPWIRPPLRHLEGVELFLDALVSEGFTDEAAVAAYRGFTSFLLGNLLLEVSNRGADIGPLDVIDPDSNQEDGVGSSLIEYPLVRRLGNMLAEDHSMEEFEEALEQLLDRLGLLLVPPKAT